MPQLLLSGPASPQARICWGRDRQASLAAALTLEGTPGCSADGGVTGPATGGSPGLGRALQGSAPVSPPRRGLALRAV